MRLDPERPWLPVAYSSVGHKAGTRPSPLGYESTTRILTVSRAVVQLDPEFHPEGERFLVRDYLKAAVAAPEARVWIHWLILASG